MRGNYSYGRARETPYYQQSVHNRPVHRTLTSEMQSMRGGLRHFPLSGDLIESMAEDILYEPGEKNFYNGALSTVLILNGTEL